MCFFPSAPKVPSPTVIPPAPTPEDTTAMQEDQRRRAAATQGRRATIFTGGLGDPGFGATAARSRRTLLGGGG